MSFIKKGGNFPHAENKPVTARAEHYERELRIVLPRVLSNLPAKLIGHFTGARSRTVKGWQAGDHLPDAGHLLALADVLPQFAEELERIRRAPISDPAAASDLSRRMFADLTLRTRRPDDAPA